jgi:hypothetical protein
MPADPAQRWTRIDCLVLNSQLKVFDIFAIFQVPRIFRAERD